jgi:uncharacterized protein with HEPN domain
MLDNIHAVQAFTAGLDFRAFCRDRKTVYAVVRALEIISEASRRLRNDMLERHPGIDWVAIAAAGNVYRHEYEAVDEALLWHTVRHTLSPLRRVVDEEYSRFIKIIPLDDEST